MPFDPKTPGNPNRVKKPRGKSPKEVKAAKLAKERADAKKSAKGGKKELLKKVKADNSLRHARKRVDQKVKDTESKGAVKFAKARITKNRLVADQARKNMKRRQADDKRKKAPGNRLLRAMTGG